jgi:myo-inositol-1(or 4)-monophosphatase
MPLLLPEVHERRELERIAVDVAREAGRLVVDERPERLEVARTKSSATDVVTVMDQRAQDLIRGRLAAARPRDGFLGEEEGGSSSSSQVTWVVDPIDGTVNYLYGIGAYAVSVAAVVGDPRVPGAWAPVAGAVVDPTNGTVFHAHAGGGAWREGQGGTRRLELDDAPSLAQALAGTGFGYDAGVREWQAQVLVRVIAEVRDIRRIGSAALDLCAVADGRLDCYYERGLNPWDLAAAWLVVTEAGGIVTGLSGGPPDSAMVLAAPPGLHPQLEALVRGAVTEVDADGTTVQAAE